ncbi:amino acid permease [Acinetobacter boissieri]|uniref:D-serine/D-alanine/glycine:proton symporter, AAT family n=1 Tax=Acinetobacter boissieri TaxID=1219383 RepID=A0A1G6GZI7_9GAMM|nr:amino acid permease [Acinetobacter boissieri]SDB87371.1 D-serine/D-alanine/glycine:proton symporter, AAT family [Acinetobacter boissieri]
MSKNTSDAIQGDLLGGHNQDPQDEDKLQRSLTNRHIQLIAIGGAIGTGLFMGTGKTLSLSGTSIVLTYLIIGFFFYFVMRAMGELLLSNTNYKSFADFATAYLGPWAGFFLGWSYWMSWVVTAIADIIVIGGYFQFWFPDLSAWIPAFITVTTLTILNLLTVKLFGETEFWFALIKIVAIIVFLLVGIYLVVTGFVSPNGVKASLSHLIEPGSIFPYGLSGFLAGFQIAVFAFIGIELVGTTAAETKDPHKTLPKAINSIPLRIILFYVGALVCIISVTSWAKVSPSQSPFVHMFTLIGLPAAAFLVNFVVTTSAMSSANSGIFATSRMMYGLAVERDAPQKFKQLSKRKVPIYSLIFSMCCIVVGTSILFIIPNVMTAFTIFSSLSTILMIFSYAIILLSYLAYRKKAPDLHEASQYKMPMGIFMSWLTLVFLLFVTAILILDHDTRIALYFSPIWFGGLYVAYKYRNKKDQERNWILTHGKRVEK